VRDMGEVWVASGPVGLVGHHVHARGFRVFGRLIIVLCWLGFGGTGLTRLSQLFGAR